jgi:acyl carrier protein
MTREQILETIRKSLRLSKIDETAKMGSVRGWDSLRHIRLILDLEKSCQMQIPADLLGSLTSVESILSYFRDSGCLTA